MSITDADVADFIETADSLYHKQVAVIQIELHKKRVAYYKGLEAWAQEELSRRPNALQSLQQQSTNYMHQWDQNAQRELQQHIKRLKTERETREKAIILFFHQSNEQPK